MADKKTILIAEDSPLNRMALCDILKDAYNVIEVENGEEALKALKESDRVVSAVILDIYMPIMDGFAVLVVMKKEGALREIPVLVCSAEEEEHAEVRALELGARDFIKKPYRKEVLLSRLRNIIKQSELEIKFSPDYDKLTGLYSAQMFYEETQQLIQENKNIRYVIVRWNIERFKLINDIFGIAKGNEILKGIGDSLKKTMANTTTRYARLEADHFVICFPYEFLDLTALIDRANELMSGFIDNYKVVSNFGIYVIDDVETPIEIMCDRAKLALNACKGNFAFPCAVYDEQMRGRMLIQQDIVSDMVQAIEQNQFEVYYQPIVDVSTSQIVSAEALVRWNHPVRGMISPGDFIPIFEENGFVTRVDEYVGKQVCKQIIKWRKEGKKIVPISINLSRLSLYDPKISDMVIGLATDNNIDPSFVKFEITEGIYIEDPKVLLKTMERLQDYGFKFLMDDFGSGYSSFNTLKDVPFNVLKLDLKFLEGLDGSNRGGAILSSIIKMAKWLNMSVIAEGVETKFQMEFLRSIGCDQMQGYYFSKPVPVDKFEELMERSLYVPNVQISVDQALADFDSIFSTNEIVNKILNSLGGGIGIYEMRGEELEALKVNDGYYTLLGYNPSTLFTDNTSIFDRQATKEDGALLKNACLYVVKSRQTQYINIRRKNSQGELVWLKMAVHYLGHYGKNPLICIAFNDITDIIEQKERQILITEELKRQHERYQVVLKQTGVIIFEWDFKSETWNGDEGFDCFVFSKQSPGAVFKGDIATNAVHPMDLPELVDFFITEPRPGAKTQKDIRLAKTDGQVVWCNITSTTVFDEYGNKMRVIGAITEIEDQIKMQQEARSQEELYRLINISNNDVILDYDVEKDTLRYTVKMPDNSFSDYRITNYMNYIPKSSIVADEFKKEYITAMKSVSENGKLQSLEYKAKYKGSDFTWHRSEFAGIMDDRGVVYRVVGWANDIQNEKDIAARLNKEQGYLNALVAESLFAFEYDFETAQATIVHQTKKYEQEFLPYKNYIGAYSQSTSIHPEDVAMVQKLFSNKALAQSFDEGEHLVRTRYRIKDKNGKWVWVECSTYLLKRQDKNTLQSLVYFKIVDSEKKAHDALVKKAQLDAVSGIYNRATVESLVEEYIESATTYSAFLLIDIDNFKSVNDTMGHLSGDKLIREIGHSLSSIFRVDDIVGRLGGDEFCVLLKNVNNESTIMDKAGQVSYAVKNIVKEINPRLMVSASVGVYMAEPQSSFVQICENADKAMYEAKNSGKDKVIIYRK